MNFCPVPGEPIDPCGVDGVRNFGYEMCVGVSVLSCQCIGRQQVKPQVERDPPEGFRQVQFDDSVAPALIQPGQQGRMIESLFRGGQCKLIAERHGRCVDRLAVMVFQVPGEKGSFLDPETQKTKPASEYCGSDAAGDGVQDPQPDFIARGFSFCQNDAQCGRAVSKGQAIEENNHGRVLSEPLSWRMNALIPGHQYHPTRQQRFTMGSRSFIRVPPNSAPER